MVFYSVGLPVRFFTSVNSFVFNERGFPLEHLLAVLALEGRVLVLAKVFLE